MEGRAVINLAGHEAEGGGARQNVTALVTLNHGGSGCAVEVVDNAEDIAGI